MSRELLLGLIWLGGLAVLGLLALALARMGQRGWGSVHRAAARGQLVRLRRLLVRSPDAAGRPDALGEYPLEYAARFGQVAAAEVLLDHGAPIDRGRLFSPLVAAVLAGHEAMVRLLLERGANPNFRDSTAEGWTVLHYAAAKGRAGIAEMLLTRGAHVNGRSAKGTTALHLAAYLGDKPTIRVLLTHHADRAATEDDRRTPADVARDQGHGPAILQSLRPT